MFLPKLYEEFSQLRALAHASFFENSLRRLSTLDDKGHEAMVRVYRPSGIANCAGFFVKNGEGRNIVISARHCFSYKVTDWCKAGGRVMGYEPGQVRSCIGIIAASTKYDVAMMEFDGTPPTKTLQIGNFLPRKGTRLQMYGFRSDKFAKKGLNATENCWIQQSTKPNYPTHFVMQDHLSTHNCSTYGGNSGGPMVIEGTNIVLGLPASYTPDNFGNRNYSKNTLGASLSTLIAAFPDSFSDVDIDFASEPDALYSGAVSKSIDLLSGTYISAAYPKWSANIQVIYNTNSTVTELKVWWWKLGATKPKMVVYKCEKDICTSTKGDRKILELHAKQFTYWAPAGNQGVFTLKTYQAW